MSGPNLDADRMDYLQRDAYFTGVATGRYDAEQLLGSLRFFERDGVLEVGIDRRGVVALESFVMARYMMFASVYFHHTTRMFEHVLHEVLRELWPDPRALDPIDEFLRWDDFRVLNALDDSASEAAYALRNRVRVYALAAEFNAERDLRAFEACEAALRERFGDAQRLGRLAVAAASPATARHRDERRFWVDTPSGPVDAREVSDVIAKLSGKATGANSSYDALAARPETLREARRICAEAIAAELGATSALAFACRLTLALRWRIGRRPAGRSGRDTASRRRSRDRVGRRTRRCSARRRARRRCRS